jgi:hypothetical protein
MKMKMKMKMKLKTKLTIWEVTSGVVREVKAAGDAACAHD